MKVVFLKDHDPNRAGDIADLPQGLANYLVAVRVARAEKEKPVEPGPEKVEMPVEPEKNSETGPAPKKEMPAKKEKVEKPPTKEKVEK